MNIAVKVLRAGVMVDAMQTTLQYRPDALYAVRVHTGAGILAVAMVDRIVVVDIFQANVAGMLVCLNLRTKRYVSPQTEKPC